MYQHKKTTLKNGLRLVSVPMPQLKSMTVSIFVGAGTRYETEKTNGISHFLEHMFFKGTKKRPSARQISTLIDGIGGEFNAGTGKETTNYYIKAAVDHLDLSFDVLTDMVLNSRLAPAEINRERGVIIEEINLYEDTPIRRVGDIFEQLLYKGTSLGWDIAGRKENIRSIKRADFSRYLDALYFPENMVVVVAGGVSHKKAQEQVEKYLGQLVSGKTKTIKRFNFRQKKPEVKMVSKKTEQAHFHLGVRGFPIGHPDRYVEGVLATILGGSMSSRLWIEIRERRGLAYYVRTMVNRYLDNGYLVTAAGVKTDQMEAAIKLVLSEYRRIAKSKVEARELKKAKDFLRGRFVLGLEDSQAVSFKYGLDEILEEKIRTPEEVIAGIERVRAADVSRVAQEVFRPERLNLAVIGPYKAEARFKKLLTL